MSVEFKTLLLGCLRKNPENRISLEEIGSHPWFSKYSSLYDLQLRFPNSPTEKCPRPMSSFSRGKLSSEEQKNHYGYIGNQAIKR